MVPCGANGASLSAKEFNDQFGVIFRSNLLNSPCNKLYSRKLIRDTGLLFPLSISLGEDLKFNVDYFASCRRFVFVPDTLYTYSRRAEGSLTSGHQESKFFETKQSIEVVRQYLRSNGGYAGENVQLVESVFAEYVIESLLAEFRTTRWTSRKERIAAIRTIINDKDVVENSGRVSHASRKTRQTYFLIRRRWAWAVYLVFLLHGLLRRLRG